MKHIYLSLVAGLLCQAAWAQVPTRSVQREERVAQSSIKTSNKTPPPYRLKELDVAALLEADKRETGRGALPQYGKPRPLAIDLLAAASWEPAADGRTGKFALTSPGARSLNFLFDKFYLPPGAELYIYNADRSTVMGPITTAQNTKAGEYATDLLKGESVTFELFEPDAARGQSILHMAQVVHGYQDLPGQPYAGYGQAEPCNVDINCAAGNGWQTESNTVALILFPTGRYGSGALLNDNCQSLTPNFLTAFHNLKQGDTKDWVFRFQYKSPTCGGAEATNYLSFSGAQLVASYELTDFALMRFNQRPAAGSGIAYAGWSRTSTAATSSASIHHPAGDVMKISLSNSAAQLIQNNYWRVDFTVGTTQPGSSGGPLFNQDHRVVGQLFGDRTPDGSSFCSRHRGDYGRFDLSWTGGGTPQTRLSDWLTTDPNVMQTNTIPVPAIAGPDQVCSQAVTYQANTTLVWTTTPAALFTTSSGYGNQFSTAGAAGQVGTGTITGTLPGACTPSVTKTVRVGSEPSGYFYGGGSSGGTLQTVQFVSPGQFSLFLNEPYSFTFSSSPAISLSNTYGRSTSFYLGAGAGVQINVSATGSSCALVGRFVFSTNGGYSYRFAPNPASSDLVVSATILDQPGSASATAAPPAELFDAALYDGHGQLVKTKRGDQGKAVLDVRDLPNGLYYLRAGQGKNAVNEHIQIAH